MVPLKCIRELKVGFYDATCPKAESIVNQIVQKRFTSDPSIVPALLRMHFHDCFVRGCDASILIDSTKEKQSEKDAGPNQTVRGFELIDEAKAALEARCPSIVSCADIITLATRDAVVLAGGPKYTIPTGRRDGLTSDINEVNLPGPQFSVSQALQSFTDKKLNLNEMVTLLGAHTVGVSHCSFFQDRLSNFQGTGQPNPSMDPTLAAKLSKTCSSDTSSGRDPTVFLDQNTSSIFDNQFYKQIVLKKGILQIDQELAMDQSTRNIVLSFASNDVRFKQSFANAMVKMGTIDVLVGNAGEIRQNCRVFNKVAKPSTPPPKGQQFTPPSTQPTKPPPSTPSTKPSPSIPPSKPQPSTPSAKPKPQVPPSKPPPSTPPAKPKPQSPHSKPPASIPITKPKSVKPKNKKKPSKPKDKKKPPKPKDKKKSSKSKSSKPKHRK
ncbi:peroxidase 57 [Carica papaya]|uniref:peroxidase 57 n=1 Tax=Carica papaya TaxID=3649 RepID=UPI000B8CC2D0|nr:peroxidase 57 [Carica papaya]